MDCSLDLFRLDVPSHRLLWVLTYCRKSYKKSSFFTRSELDGTAVKWLSRAFRQTQCNCLDLFRREDLRTYSRKLPPVRSSSLRLILGKEPLSHGSATKNPR